MTIFLRLGSVTFQDFEIPERINFGGDQMLSVKKLVGGMRIVDPMGRDDADISWSGLFFGSNAIQRAQFIDTMRVQGIPLPLTWGTFNYLVLIQKFDPKFERSYQIPYSITCIVIQDLNKPFPIAQADSYNTAINNQNTQAQDIASIINVPSISDQIANLNNAVSNVPDFDAASSGQIASVQAPLTSTQQAVAAAIAANPLSGG